MPDPRDTVRVGQLWYNRLRFDRNLAHKIVILEQLPPNLDLDPLDDRRTMEDRFGPKFLCWCWSHPKSNPPVQWEAELLGISIVSGYDLAAWP